MSHSLHAIAVFATVASIATGADPSLTIYNQNFAVIREAIPLDLASGANRVRFSGATAHLEPDSVILSDPSAKRPFVVQEQNYRADPVSQELLLNLYEGKTIEFAVAMQDGSVRAVPGKIIRSGYVPPHRAMRRYGQQYQFDQTAVISQPIIEVNGKVQFSLPGQPIFPALGDDTILKPSLDWIVRSPQAASFDAELSYVTGGMSWSADYNLVAQEIGDRVDLVGWVTLENQSGKQFDHARIKLMAGDVNKLAPGKRFYRTDGTHLGNGAGLAPPAVVEHSFDDYHLYDLPLPTTLHDQETKQVELMRASGISSRRGYVYDGIMENVAQYAEGADLRIPQSYGTQQYNPQVWIMREFANTEANHLGMPLPKGRVRFYRRDRDGQLEFIGEGAIHHTAKDEPVKLYTGNAFDITGEHKQTDFKFQKPNSPGGFADESFEVKIRNHKKEPATVTVVEHVYRWTNWKIMQESSSHRQTDRMTIEYEVTVQPDQEKEVTYTVRYSW